MTTIIDHPFQPGTEVAIMSGYENQSAIFTTVARVHKTGRFTVEHIAYRDRQWKPEKWQGRSWTASEAHSRLSIRVVDDELRTEIAERKAKRALAHRAAAALEQTRSARAEFLTEWQVEALEQFVRLYKGAN